MTDDADGSLEVLRNEEPPSFDAHIPDRIGPYRLYERLGTTEIGEVYRAERRTPLHQTVVIKLIKLGLNLDSYEVIARFESERQTLARMDHPNIGRMLDGGITEAGRAYFVMDFVPGVPITMFCDENRLNIRERLLLFRQTCEAIAHAHSKAIIHRDVKPSNVLAFLQHSKLAVKVIDFGIAKALTGERVASSTLSSTCASMSPEQASGSPDIDTRSDIYSLGALLYELLTGSAPFDPKTLSPEDVEGLRRIIREVDPLRPSAQLGEAGENANEFAVARQSRLKSLARQLHRELEWIPLKAMHKDRDRRYSTPLQLIEDIDNYLAGRPLIAGPESKTYRIRKCVGRHRLAVLSAALIIAIVVSGAIYYICNIHAELERTQAALVEAGRQTDKASRPTEAAAAQTQISQPAAATEPVQPASAPATGASPATTQSSNK